MATSFEVINIGAAPNDGSGDPLRVAFTKVNNNFSQLYSSGFFTYQSTTFNNTPNQVIFQVSANNFTQATFQINSANPANQNSQNITINASIRNNGTLVQWVGHSTIFINTPVTNYDVAYDSITGNVQLKVSPLVNATLNHFISAQVTDGAFSLGTPLGLEGNSGDFLATENNDFITTE